MDKDYLIKCLDKGMTTRDIEKECGKDHRTISYWINKYQITDKSKYAKTDKFRFEKIDTKEKAYILGFILADGSITEKEIVDIAVSLYDKKVLEFIGKNINAHVHYSHVLNKANRRFPKARITKKIPDIRKFYGGRKKEDRHYPRVRKDLERYLLQGVFDADGCLTWGHRKDRNRLWYKVSFSSQLKILEGVQKYLYTNLGISTMIKPKANEKCYVLSFSNLSSVLKFCEHIYPNEEFIILNRKYLKYKALRLELEENGKINRSDCQYRAEPAEQEGVETSGEAAMLLNDRNSIQGC